MSLAFEILFYILLSILKGILWRKDQFLGLTKLRVFMVLGGGWRGIQFFSSLRIKHLCFLSLWENSRHGGFIPFIFLSSSFFWTSLYRKIPASLICYEESQYKIYARELPGWKPSDSNYHIFQIEDLIATEATGVTVSGKETFLVSVLTSRPF